MFIWTGSTGQISFFSRDAYGYSHSLNDFFVTNPRCYKIVYVNSFFPRTARLGNSLSTECFSLRYDLIAFMSRINRRTINCRFFLKRFPVCFNLFCAFFVTPVPVVAVQPCMVWIVIKRNTTKTIHHQKQRTDYFKYESHKDFPACWISEKPVPNGLRLELAPKIGDFDQEFVDEWYSKLKGFSQ